jgi:hypothetical protein
MEYKVGQEIKYRNGWIQTGKIVEIKGKNFVVINDEAGMELWNAGYAVGDCIRESQIIEVLK